MSPPSMESTADSIYAWYDAVDYVISGLIFNALERIGIDIRNANPVNLSRPLVSSPTPAVLLVAVYLFVTVAWSLSIKFLGLRPLREDPVFLRRFVILHNFLLCGLSLYMGAGIAYQTFVLKYSFMGNALRTDEEELGFLIYVFYISKFYEFLDTVIMLLKRNLRQVSYLHVYHHASISLIWWVMAYRCPGGDAYFSALFNSWIHVIMYAYYLLAALIGKDERKRKKYLFWGKYLTMLQIIQFVSFILQSIYGMFRTEGYPPGICPLLFVYSLSLLLFFCDFFFKKYKKTKTHNNETPQIVKKTE